MNPQQFKAICTLRDEGYAVILWAPEELGDVSPDTVEDRSIELGWDVITQLQGAEG